jgi:PLP dependent protein
MDIAKDITVNYFSVSERIASACYRAGRKTSEITLIAVSKKQSIEKMLAYMDVCKQHNHRVVFGENYVQEFKNKKNLLKGEYKTHLIGLLQKNKSKDALVNFDCIESVHNISLLKELEKVAEKNKIKREIFLQVNISSDDNKGGFEEVELRQVFEQCLPQLRFLNIVGLMTITKFYENAEDVRPDFVRFRKLKEALYNDFPSMRNKLLLSMGMSQDFDIAIEEGADLVRVGTALFGDRT